MSYTMIKYYGEQKFNRCGYCRQTASSNSHGMHAFVMTPRDYQDLIDRGWRRSGLYCYKPNNRNTCCPSYTIRCNSQEFKLSKSHKKILKRMRKFLTDGMGVNDLKRVDRGRTNEERDNIVDYIPCTSKEEERNLQLDIQMDVTNKTNKFKGSKLEGSCLSLPKSGAGNSKGPEEGKSVDGLRTLPKKAKQIRLERKKAKLAERDITAAIAENSRKAKNQEKSLSDYLNDIPENGRHKIKVILIPSNMGVTETVIELYRKYQVAVHNDPPEKITKKSFERFLVRSPLKPITELNGPDEGYGSFHQQYWLDNELIAVGVIDILPCCVSSVYFFYDPDYSFLSLGTYGSLREIDYTRQLSEKTPDLKYYYMGFYIHSCPKMIYKGQLSASYLLCPEVYTWHLLTDDIRAKLDKSKYQRLNADLTAKDVNECNASDINKILLYLRENRMITLENYIKRFGSDLDWDSLQEYGKLVGKPCAHRMLYLNF